jgi:hypothetical protein
MNSFAERIRSIEAKMNQLKTFGLSSSSSVTTTSKTVTVPMQIVPYKINYEWDACAGQYSYRIRVNWTNASGLCSLYIKSPANLQGRSYNISRLTDSSFHTEFGVEINAGSTQDLDIFNGGGSVPQFNLVLEIVATANFTITYTSRQEH